MDASAQIAFDLGWDHATFGLNVPETADKMFCDGYRAFASGGNRKTRIPDVYIRKWLQIRFGALARNKPFATDVTPDYIKKITPSSGACPIIELQFTFGAGKPTDWSIDRANNERGYFRGNIIVISQFVNAAKSAKSLDDIWALAKGKDESDGLSPCQWQRLAQLIEPAFGELECSESPVRLLTGQPVALGMPVSPLASLQVLLTRAVIAGWNAKNRKAAANLIAMLKDDLCSTKDQRRSFDKLINEVFRRTRHISSYWEVWGTPRIQKRLFSFVATLDGAGLSRVVALQDTTIGAYNTKIA